MPKLYAVACMLSKHEGLKSTYTQTLSYRQCDSEDEAKGAAAEYALTAKPGFAIELITAIEIPQ